MNKKIDLLFSFIYPLSISLVDIVINISIINLRIDDLIIYIYVIINLKNIISNKIEKIQKEIYPFILFSLISFLIILIRSPDLINKYEVVRSIGSIPHIISLPIILSKKNNRKYFYIGAIIGSVIYIYFVFNNYFKISYLGNIDKISTIKDLTSFESINPNTVATLALILGWINILNKIEYKKNISLFIAIILFIIPVLIYARASSIGLGISILILFFLNKKGKQYLIIFVALIILILIILNNYTESNLFIRAYSFNLKTGEGTSNRTELWKEGIELIKMSPIIGHGFGTENGLYKKYFDGHMSHQILIHYWIELGLLGLLYFLYIIIKILIYKIKNLDYELGKVQMAILICFIVADMAGQLLYFNKYAYLIFSIIQFNRNNKEIRNENI